jgi:hypothetical protein
MLCARLRTAPGRVPRCVRLLDDPLVGDDLHLALHICYGLHYDGFAGVDEAWEWEPSLLRLRAEVEGLFVASLAAEAEDDGASPGRSLDASATVALVRRLLSQPSGPSLSSFMADHGTMEQLREFVVHRSIYQRKEADGHTWAIPRLRGRAKSALVALQADEYGGGIPGQSHAELFATTMRMLDLDPAPGAHIDVVPGSTLATDNLVSYFGLHRRWRGALVGHLAAFEMTSVLPMSRYAAAVRRILGSGAAAEFYDVHVTADVVHEVMATDELIVGLAESDPEALGDVPFGVAALVGAEGRFSAHLLNCWANDTTSLRDGATPTELSGDPIGQDASCELSLV